MAPKYFLFFDIETTGLLGAKKKDIDFRKSEQFPHIVQISWQLHEYENEKYTTLSDVDYIIKPDNYTIPEESSKIHGISQSEALEKGTGASDVYRSFIRDLTKNPNTILVCHNIEFDVTILFYHIYKIYKKEFKGFLDKKVPCICTMLDSINYCKLPSTSKYAKPSDPYKYPKLSELYAKLFGDVPKGQLHNSKYDVECTIKCFQSLFNMELLHIRYASLVFD
jgi:DNA polymerase-3 subunit epsilon